MNMEWTRKICEIWSLNSTGVFAEGKKVLTMLAALLNLYDKPVVGHNWMRVTISTLDSIQWLGIQVSLTSKECQIYYMYACMYIYLLYHSPRHVITIIIIICLWSQHKCYTYLVGWGLCCSICARNETLCLLMESHFWWSLGVPRGVTRCFSLGCTSWDQDQSHSRRFSLPIFYVDLCLPYLNSGRCIELSIGKLNTHNKMGDVSH